MRIEPTTIQTLVGCSNHWATKNSSDEQVILWANITVILIKIENENKALLELKDGFLKAKN